MQIAHRKTQTDHRVLSDRTDALAARVDAVQADLRGTMRDNDEVEALRMRMQAAEDLFTELQGRLSAAEVALTEAKAQAEAQAQAVEQVVQTTQAAQAQAQAEAEAEVAVEIEVSPCRHAPSALCAYSAQAVAAPASSTITPITSSPTPATRKRKRAEEDDGVHEEDDEQQEGNSAGACRPKVQARKRPRRLARAAVQATAAAVIGAVAAWSALAFV